MARLKVQTAPTHLEEELRAQGFRLIGGMDEAGRGPLAGPVCAAVVVFEPGVMIEGVFDSKQLEEDQREELFEIILQKALAVGIGLACAESIDQLNILRATKLAARRALRHMAIMPDHLLLDALTLDQVTIPQKAVVKGDALSFSIAAASIVAKVTRDRLMVKCADQFPGYGFEKHKGYGTPAHRRAIAELGRTTLHRNSFLEAWFDGAEPRCSRLYETLAVHLQKCNDEPELQQLINRAREHRHWLPACEWNRLCDLASVLHRRFIGQP